jgi:hypothetical protein
MQNYLWVNPGRLKKGRHVEKTDGMEITVEISPYDLPTSVVGGYDPKTGRFVITFRYIDREDAVESPSKKFEGVTFLEGKNSGKLLSIQIAIDAPPMDNTAVISLKTKVMEALRHRRDSMKEPESLNQDVAEEILDQKEDFEALVRS